MDRPLFKDFKDRIVENCSKVIVGKEDVICRILIAFVCSGHVLLEDVPGTGKTVLLRAFSTSLGGKFKRIQFTPDLLPSDLTGINFYNQKTGEFEFREGPLFANIVLADEINRATPRTQSSLLEAMAERQITVDGITTRLAEPFMVMATQNPLESYGTFPLPEAQTDRFFMKLTLGYMTREEEISVISRRDTEDILAELTTVVTPSEIAEVRKAYHDVIVSAEIKNYIMDIIERTRNDSRILTGVSTRGAIALYHAAQVCAAFAGRDYVIPEDIQDMAQPVLAHRLVTGGMGAEKDVSSYFMKLLAEIPAPVEQV